MIIDRIHEFNRFGMVLGLDRMEELLRRLGNPQDDLKVIHVAGTNGKGSVSKYLEEGLSACGYKMGLYTSPYIETFNERIRYDGADISCILRTGRRISRSWKWGLEVSAIPPMW